MILKKNWGKGHTKSWIRFTSTERTRIPSLQKNVFYLKIMIIINWQIAYNDKKPIIQKAKLYAIKMQLNACRIWLLFSF